MTLKVLSTSVPASFPFGGKDGNGLYTAERDFTFCAICRIDGVVGKLRFDVKAGCKYNGASNPLNWPIKNYYDNPKVDCCGLGHDLLYAHGGFIVGLSRKLKPGEFDDYIRGSMRECDFERRPAGVVDMAVRNPVVHLLHFGKIRDKEGMHKLSAIVWFPGVTC